MALPATSPALIAALQDAFYTANKDYDECVLDLGSATSEAAADACLTIAAAKFAAIAGPAITVHILSATVTPGQVVTTASAGGAGTGATTTPGIII